MHRPSLRLSIVAIALAVACFSAACGTDSPEGTSAKNIKELPKDLLTDTYLGLKPAREDVTETLKNQEANAYVTAVGLYSLRKGDRLEATLQISKLSKNARPKDAEFREQVASQIGGTKVREFTMGGRQVYRSSQRKQSLSAWFKGDYFMILAVRDTYATPRSLLRVLLTDVDVT